ncbi:hypothetical protein YPPY100_1812, partial [Yersinia pestis PY-100]
MPNALG